MRSVWSRAVFGGMAGCITLAAATQSAHAQSSVTLFGILDEGVMFQSNAGAATGGKRYFLDSTSGINGSRWGLTGAEDLGGGLRAVFMLENGINLNTGAMAQGGTLWGRQAYVGLASSRWGSLTLGRQYDMMFYFGQPITSAGAQAGSAPFVHPGDLDNTANTVRVNNSVRYMSTDYAGFKFGGLYSFGGVAGDFTASSGYSAGASYTHGPFSIAAAFDYFKNPSRATAGTGFFTDNANGVTTLANALNSGYTSATAYQTGVIGATYALGAFTFSTSYSNTQYGNLNGSFRDRTARFDNIDAAVRYAASPALSFSLAYDYLRGRKVARTDGSTVGNQHFNQVSLMSDYLLSKRTDVYLEGAWQRASGNSSTGGAAVADIGNLGDSSNNHQFVVRAALRHRF